MTSTTIDAGVLGTGFYVPERILTNFDLEKMVDTSDEWIVERTGIRERRIAGADETVASMGTAAAQQIILGDIVRAHGEDLHAVDHMAEAFAAAIGVGVRADG